MSGIYYEGYAELQGWDGSHDPDADAYFDALALRAYIPEKASIVEVGFGNGDFLRWCAKRGHAVFGYELQSALIERARASGFDVAEIPVSETRHREVDVIAAFDVLEHLSLEQLETFFAVTSRFLKPDGRYVLRFPNGASPFGGRIQSSDITHIQSLSVASLRQVAGRHGFADCRSLTLRTYPSGLIARAKRWLAYKAQDVVGGAINLIYYGGSGADYSPNAVVLALRG